MKKNEKKIIGDYELIEKIGAGPFTEVHKAKNNKTKELRALKIIKLDNVEQLIELGEGNLEDYIKRLKNEINSMILCEKNNINSIKFFEYFQTKDKFVIVLELCDTNLNNFKKDKSFDSEQIYEILTQLNNTFKIMMKNKIVHRDLKPDNILVKKEKNDSYIFKLCDYGISKIGNLSRITTHTGTLLYMAPEIMRLGNVDGDGDVKNYNYKCDLWSLGIIIYELFFKVKPYLGDREYAVLKKIDLLGKKAIKKTGDDKLDELISGLLESNPKERLTWDQYFNHKFFKKEKSKEIKNIDIKENDNEELNKKAKDNKVMNNKASDEITLIYKKIDNENKIRIFGKEFVENNRNKCNIIYKGKNYKLEQYFEIPNGEDTLEIKLVGLNDVTDISYMFSNCEALKYISDISNLKVDKLTNISHLFSYCESLESLPDISSWNTSNITDMSDLFSNCILIKSLPDISMWDTSNVTNMSYMLFNCESLSSLPDISLWKTNKVTNMSYLFFNCKALSSIPNISSWSISNLINTNGMFYGCNFPLNDLTKFIKE